MIKMKPIQNRFTPPWNLQKNDGCENLIDTFVRYFMKMNVYYELTILTPDTT